MKYKDFTCQHIIAKKDKSIYIFPLIDRDLCICEKCHKKLFTEIIKQDKLEEEMAEEWNEHFKGYPGFKCKLRKK